jgi:hypothetical protein
MIGHNALVTEVTATAPMRGAVPPSPPPAPPHSDDQPPPRGVVHAAGRVFSGVQRCGRCGLALPLPPGDATFEVGALIEHIRFVNGERMTSAAGRAPLFPYCDER